MSDKFHPRDFRRSLRRAGITATAYRVAVELSEYASATKSVVWPSIDTLAVDCEVSRSAIIRALNQLEAKSFIACAGDRSGGRGRPTRWRLLTQKGCASDTVLKDGASDTLSAETVSERVSSEAERVSNSALKGVSSDTRSSKEEEQEGERSAHAREEPLDVEAVPIHGNALSPQNHHLLNDNDIIDGEVVDSEPDDHEPPQYCAAHVPYGTGLSCRGCKTARINHEAWTRRQKDKAATVLFHEPRQRQADQPPAPPQPRCLWCHDGGIVLNGDGKPGRHIRICHHDHTWHIATPEELAEREDAAS